MLAYEGPATLHWWANLSFAVRCEVLANIEATDAGWRVVLASASDGDRTLVDDLPNPWQLCFEDGSAFQVDLQRGEQESTWIASEARLRA